MYGIDYEDQKRKVQVKNITLHKQYQDNKVKAEKNNEKSCTINLNQNINNYNNMAGGKQSIQQQSTLQKQVNATAMSKRSTTNEQHYMSRHQSSNAIPNSALTSCCSSNRSQNAQFAATYPKDEKPDLNTESTSTECKANKKTQNQHSRHCSEVTINLLQPLNNENKENKMIKNQQIQTQQIQSSNQAGATGNTLLNKTLQQNRNIQNFENGPPNTSKHQRHNSLAPTASQSQATNLQNNNNQHIQSQLKSQGNKGVQQQLVVNQNNNNNNYNYINNYSSINNSNTLYNVTNNNNNLLIEESSTSMLSQPQLLQVGPQSSKNNYSQQTSRTVDSNNNQVGIPDFGTQLQSQLQSSSLMNQNNSNSAKNIRKPHIKVEEPIFNPIQQQLIQDINSYSNKSSNSSTSNNLLKVPTPVNQQQQINTQFQTLAQDYRSISQEKRPSPNQQAVCKKGDSLYEKCSATSSEYQKKPKNSEDKTESTYISGGDSNSYILECEEFLPPSNLNTVRSCDQPQQNQQIKQQQPQQILSNNKSKQNLNNNTQQLTQKQQQIQYQQQQQYYQVENTVSNIQTSSNATATQILAKNVQNDVKQQQQQCIQTLDQMEQNQEYCQSLEASPIPKAKIIQSLQDQDDEVERLMQECNTENNVCAIDAETLSFLVEREDIYAPDPQYLKTKQQNINWIMRAILVDWIMEVCMEFTMKRETFHITVNLVDRYLSKTKNIQKMELQLYGVAAMYIASKIEEIYPPKMQDFVKSADEGYTAEQIKESELNILRKTQWLVNPPTLNMWANWFMSQWDIYIEHSTYAKYHPLINQTSLMIQFKQPNEQSYICYRDMMQLIDVSTLDIQSLQYKPRTLIAAFMYLILGKHYQQFTSKEIVEEFPHTSLFLINTEWPFNDIFSDFLNFSFGFALQDLLPTIQYAASFFILQLKYDLPTAAKLNRENVLEGHFEEFLAYQTHNAANLECIRNRQREINQINF